MARPKKSGLSYFPLDTDFFDNDSRIKILKARYRADGIMIYVYLLCEIYKNGYYIQVDDDLEYIIASELGVSVDKVKQVLNFLLKKSLFDSKLFSSDKVFLSKNLYATMLTVVCMTLHDQFGYGKKRLLGFKEKFDELTKNATNLDYLGEHYVTLEDYAVYLNEEFDLGIDTARVATCQESYDEHDERFRAADIEEVLKVLREDGYEEAAEFLQGKLR